MPVTIEGTLAGRAFTDLGGLATVLTIALAELVYLFEHRPGGAMRNFADSVVWATSIVIGVQADSAPTSHPGQLVMLAGFATGVILIAILTGSLGAFLLEGRGEHEGKERSDAP